MRRLAIYSHHILSALCSVGALCWMNIVGCAAPAKQLVFAPVTNPPTSVTIQALINKLAISDEDAAAGPVFTPSTDTPKTDRRVMAYDAAEELKKFGAEAFPLLLASLDDIRQSVAFRRVLPSTIGDACYTLITIQLYSLPPDYSGSICRKGADGRLHERPVFSNDLFATLDLKHWLAARRGHTLRELQIEALGWVLSEEEKIGAATPSDEEKFLAPLRARYSVLKGK